jgi:predicted dithiol-disulfide oxidoreductase (DUF899 family)
MKAIETPTQPNTAVSSENWFEALKMHSAKESEFEGLRDKLTGPRLERRELKIEKRFVFEGPQGKENLADLFEGLSQSIVFNFISDSEDTESHSNYGSCPIILTAPLFI